MKKKSGRCSMGVKVKKHLKEDMGEFREQIADDKKLLKVMKSKMSSKARSK